MRLDCVSLIPPQVFILAVAPDDAAAADMPIRLVEVRLVKEVPI